MASQTVAVSSLSDYASPLGKIEGKSDGHSVSGIVCCLWGGRQSLYCGATMLFAQVDLDVTGASQTVTGPRKSVVPAVLN